MEGGTLFNSGFLGASFLWWVGQIADDSTWRDNISPGIHKSKYSIPGWGRRYKVRIIGLHDQGEIVIPSDQLPWAQIMYTVTAGGGQTDSGQTSNLRQGMMVFGFFLDGQDQQVPVIMGVLGNNSQTALSNEIGTDKVTNEKPGSLEKSGFAKGKKPKPAETKEKVPDYGKDVEKPKDEETAKMCAAPPPGVKLNKFGLRPDIPQSKFVLGLSQSARAQLETDPILQGLNFQEKEDFVMQKVADGIKQKCKEANSPGSPTQPGATIEQVDSVHKLDAAHVKREDKLIEPIPLMKPDDKINCALKNIQMIIDNITKKIKKYISAINHYIDAVTNVISDIKKFIADAACEIAKYLKLIFDHVMNYVLSKLNSELKKVVSAMPLSMRTMFGDMKEIITELILCLYNKITSNLCGLITSLLNKALQPEKLEREARQQQVGINKPPSYPYVPMCYAEDLTADIIFANKESIDSANNSILDNIDSFLTDIQDSLADVSGALNSASSILDSVGDIAGSLNAALSFESIKLNVFGCEIKQNLAVSDFYTFATGGASMPDSEIPNFQNVEQSVANKTEIPKAVEPKQFAEPTRATKNIDNRVGTSTAETRAAAAEERNLARQAITL